jgi:hypothetical protein
LRVPTQLERQGDFSQTIDNNGNLYPYIKDPLLTGTCTAANTSPCFQDGGVVGRIPANRLYDQGLNILKMYPTANVAGQVYNYEIVRPTEKLTANQPAVQSHYQPTPAARHVQLLRLEPEESGQRLDPASTIRSSKPVVSTLAATANYVQSDDVSRRRMATVRTS